MEARIIEFPKEEKKVRIRTVRLQVRDIRGIENYSVTVPRKFIEVLKWKPKEELKPLLIEVELKPGRKVKGVFFYKP